VIVHETVTPSEFSLIEHVCEIETPAHIVTRVRRADADFIVGLTALLSVDTFLRPHPLPKPVEVETTAIGDAPLLKPPPPLKPRPRGMSVSPTARRVSIRDWREPRDDYVSSLPGSRTTRDRSILDFGLRITDSAIRTIRNPRSEIRNPFPMITMSASPSQRVA